VDGLDDESEHHPLDHCVGREVLGRLGRSLEFGEDGERLLVDGLHLGLRVRVVEETLASLAAQQTSLQRS